MSSSSLSSSAAILRSATRSKASKVLPGFRAYAQVGPTTFVGGPPPPPAAAGPSPSPAAAHTPTAQPSQPPSTAIKSFDARVLSELQKTSAQDGMAPQSRSAPTPLTELVEQYMKRAGHVLGVSLPYESRPDANRRALFPSSKDATEGNVEVDSFSTDRALVMVAHAVHDRTGKHKVTYSSGFAVHAPGFAEGESLLVTCAHTLEEIRHDPLMRAAHPSLAVPSGQVLSGSFVIAGSPATPTFRPVSSVLSAMHRGDLLLLSAPSPSLSPHSPPHPPLRSLPVSPYPVHPGTPIRTHFVADKPPESGPEREGWTPWLGGTWRKWVRGTVVGYRDYAGREAKPGTYDSLAHLHFEPSPTPGSSGGPIIDEESGSVIGVVLGTQLANQVEGIRGWGVPSEMIYEMFSLPGLTVKRQ